MKTHIKFILILLLCGVSYFTHAQGSDVIFIIDNSGSINTDSNDNLEYDQMKTSIDLIIDEVLTCNPENRAAVVQYVNTGLEIEFDFINDITTAQNFTRAFDNGSSGDLHTNLVAIGDALDGNANTQIVSTQTTLNRINSNSLTIFIFTDDSRFGLVNQASSTIGTNGAFLEYTNFKNNRNATFFVVHVSPNDIASYAAAAIASEGGSYGGTVEQYPADPDSGANTRFYYPFSVNDVTPFILNGNDIAEITADLCNQSDPPCEDLSFLPNPDFSDQTISWDDVANSYEVEIIGSPDNRLCRDQDPNHPSNQLVSFTTTSNSISFNDIFNTYGFDCFYIRVRQLECNWTDWCYYRKDGLVNCLPSCIDDDIYVTETIANTESINYLGYNNITADNIIESGASSVMTASNSIKLNEDFNALNGAYFNAYIQECVTIEDGPIIITNNDIIYSGNADDSPNTKNKNLNEDEEPNFEIYPNPTKDLLNVRLNQGKIKSLALYNIYGKVMLSKKSASKHQTIDVQNIKPGIYILKVVLDDNSVINERIIIK